MSVVPSIPGRFAVGGSRSTWLSILAATTIGVYLLVIVGATTAMADGASACAGWPTCDGQWLVLDPGPMLVAWLHRFVAGLVGIAFLVTALGAFRWAPDRLVFSTVVVAAGLYPFQMAIGAAMAIGGPLSVGGSLHLAVGLVIFALLVIALGRALDHRYGQASESNSSRDRTDVAPTPAIESPPAGSIGWRKRVMAYVELTKPRLMWLLCLVALAAMALAAGPSLSPVVVLATLLGGILAIGASGTFNHVLERDIDRKMARTADRPVVQYTVPVINAIGFGVVLAITSIGIFVLAVNLLAAALAATAIVFYSIVYTLLLKPNTVQNTVIGGVAGALPAFIGWAAVTGSIGWPSVALATLIFCWTPAHFYNLAMAYKTDYARADIPMLPVVKGDRTTRRHIVWYLGLTLIAAALLATVEGLGLAYALVTAGAGAVFFVAVVHLYRRQTRAAAFRSFHASNAFLAVVLLAVLVDALIL